MRRILGNMSKTAIITFVVIVLSLLVSAPGQMVMAADGEQMITFNDAVLYERIKLNLDYYKLGYTDAGNNTVVLSDDVLAQVYTLNLQYEWKGHAGKIVDLTGIEYFSNLEALYLDENEIVDLTPLSGLVHLTTLELEANKIVDVTPLSGLVNLKMLVFGAENHRTSGGGYKYNQIADITPLTNLKQLVYLSVDRAALKVLPEMYFPNMKTLVLTDNSIENIDVINKDSLPALETLYIGQNLITDVASLSGMTTLTDLCLAQNRLTDEDLEYIGQMSSLEKLNLGIKVTYGDCRTWNIYNKADNKLTDYSALTGMTNLKVLMLDGCGITSLKSFEGFKGKEVRIELEYNAVTDFADMENQIVVCEQHYGNDKVKFNTYDTKIELPYVLLRVTNENDVLYSASGLTCSNCEISEDGKYIIFKNSTQYEDYSASIVVKSGKMYSSEFKWSIDGLPHNGMVYMSDDNKYHYVVDCVTDTSVNDLFPYEGEWWHMKEGIWLEDTYGFVDFNGGKFFVANGKLHNITGLALYNEEWYFLSDGQLIKDYTGLAMFDNEWFRVENGKFTSDFNGIQEYDGADFLISSGKIRHDYSGLFLKEDGNWCYVANGQIQKQHTGFVQHDNEWFYLVEGVIATGANGIFEYDGAYFLLGEDGRMIQEYCGLYQNTDGKWYYVANGQVQTQYTGLVKHDGVWFYVENGMFNETFAGWIEYDGSVFQIWNGTVVEQ